MTRVFVALLPILALVTASDGAVAGESRLWQLAQNAEQYEDQNNVPAEIPADAPADTQYEPSTSTPEGEPGGVEGGSQDEAGGVEAHVAPPTWQLPLASANRD